MNTAQLKTYAPHARHDFIAAVTARAAKFGITAEHIEPIIEQGDVALIGDKAYPRSVAENRRKIEARIEQQGFDQVMEAMAYTWFNRFMAIRYMELHGYLDHGRRVLSHPEKRGAFEILEACTEIELPGLDNERVVELKLDGSKDEELYRLLLLGQCHALHQAMPFLFEAIEDDTELLLPDNLTKTDSLIRHLVDDIPEDSWDDIEIVGWLYQFYISEKKDQVIGKVVKSEDIPAATQLFTPNWIVKYMVQNSLGAQWLATYPDSKLKEQMEYYIEPAEQTEEVQAQLKEITPTSLDPEELTLIDPACGSGHILVEAYELFKAIYLERGYRQRDVPQLILERNLFGLDIDERAAQLTGFALMMKGRADDRRLFDRGVTLNVMALQDSTNFDADKVIEGANLDDHDLKPKHLTGIKNLFEHASTFGSLIQVPDDLEEKLPALGRLSKATSEDLFVSEALKRLELLVRQAELLAAQYDAVVANPPYMGNKFHDPSLKRYLRDNYKGYEKDLFSAFIRRNGNLTKRYGYSGFMTPMVWMFISTHENLRLSLLDDHTLESLVQLEYNASGAVRVPLCTFLARNGHIRGFEGSYIRLTEFGGDRNQGPRTLDAIRDPDCGWLYRAKPDEFKNIPGSPVAYWVSDATRRAFTTCPSLGGVADIRQGMATTDNVRFLRLWPEVSLRTISLTRDGKEAIAERPCSWFPYNKGGAFRKWFGNEEFIVDYAQDGAVLLDLVRKKYPRISDPEFVIKNRKYYFRPCTSWSDVTSSATSARYVEPGHIFDTVGPSAFSRTDDPAEIRFFLALINSKVAAHIIPALNPTLHFNLENAKSLPAATSLVQNPTAWEGILRLIDVSRDDWDAYERSWDFQTSPLVKALSESTPSLESSYAAWITENKESIAEMKRLEEENNRLFIDAYGLANELTPDVPIEQITLTVNPAYRYGGKLDETEQWTRFRQDSMEELVSYAIGCILGRYSLYEPGLIYADSGNEDFDASKYTAFAADDDGIVPVTDTDWFTDDACNRLIEFISVAWNNVHLEANLTFLAENLSPRKTESSRETIRRYLYDKFFKAHLQTYKKRPIYWLFSSGKQKAFQCLVYLHRYNEGTLARMRTEYVIPLQGKMSSRIDQLDSDIAATSSTAHRKKLEKERDKLAKQRVELQEFDEKLRHYADQRINLDLDDGVKVNYGKFGDLLAEVKAVTGKKPT